MRDRLQEYLVSKPHPYARTVKILQAMEPQLVVVKALLLDRMQRLESGSVPVIVSRIARSSYGVVCKARYDPNIHLNENVVTDPLDGQKYAMGMIDWLIKKVSLYYRFIKLGFRTSEWDLGRCCGYH